MEIGCEELPPFALKSISYTLSQNIMKELKKSKLSFGSIYHYATPRRLAVLVKNLVSTQKSRTLERLGPNVQSAFSEDGTPTETCLGFARSCGVSINQLQTKMTEKGKFLYCYIKQSGQSAYALLPKLIQSAVKNLSISKTMRWDSMSGSFIRPVRWIVMLLDKKIVPITILGHTAKRKTFGHRFHHPKAIFVPQPHDYQDLLLNRGKVLADFDRRREKIRKLIEKTASSKGETAIDEKLLEEVTGMVEWPVAFLGCFKTEFLSLPSEILITVMQDCQRCFPIKNEKGALLPHFILISNIESKNPKYIVEGNERVINSRLSDASLFYKRDLKTPLKDQLLKLSGIVFQKRLGTLLEKTTRMSKLSIFIANKIKADEELTKKAASLAKCDLVSKTVCEFPRLQGIIGYYYTLCNKESETVAQAIRDHYLPRFSEDDLPKNLEGICVALADRLDTLVGIIGINSLYTGNKDPFALRRAALGILRILIEKKLPLDLLVLLKKTEENYIDLPNKNAVFQTFEFIIERLRSWYLEKNVHSEIVTAILAVRSTEPLDFDRRIKALQYFQALPEIRILTTVNKRLNNILKKKPIDITINKIDFSLFDSDIERDLTKELTARIRSIGNLYKQVQYKRVLDELAKLKDPIDRFFDRVVIMTDDKKKRNNRLAVLISLQRLFTTMADFSVLS
ncbi:glycine--tRNA ligase subunit beta [Coxiella endosymbiont of Amblyomma sculptum]|uniref:glycine--tRNA ligase subunit beta n=1 Tax=Coxiella endosymbiont of Amblyomma sculptum TaxID=2487929 RepID=UPI001FE32B0A|nr:glycine--tRNA ligase subunit beta [Coxiella endosymbiont of Amblyomma sculptum]